MARWSTCGAVGHEGEILESYITKSRHKEAALTFVKKALKRHGSWRFSLTAPSESLALKPLELLRDRQLDVAAKRSCGERVVIEIKPSKRRILVEDVEHRQR